MALMALWLSVWGGVEAQVVSDRQTVADTEAGKVQGYRDGDVYTFKGIQYAEAERFMPPTGPKHFEGVRMCRIYGPKAPQNESLKWNGNRQSDYDFGFQFNLEPMDEAGCLVLNVWTKGLGDGKKRPVLVWIHGGGYATGSGHDLPCYDGKALAGKGDIVVVTVNHRLNVLGYYDASGLGGRYSQSVNLGQQDLVKALEWVRHNIANFGGDASNVTIGGQSGGGAKVSTLMMMPSARGLFQKAIVQSGSFARYGTNGNAKLYADALLRELKVTADQLKDVPYGRLAEAADKSIREVNAKLGTTGGFGGLGPVIDGNIVVGPGFDKAAPEMSADVPMMIGWNYNEFDFVGGRKDEMFSSAALNQATLKARQGKAPVYVYEFDWKPKGNTLGACHGMELAFMFNNIALQPEMNGATEEAFELSDIMSTAWINFIKRGNPSTWGMPRWGRFDPERKNIMVFDEQLLNQVPDVHDPVMARCDGKYYIYFTGMYVSSLVSADMKKWRSQPSLMPEAPRWAVDAVSGYGGHTWAPDIQKVGDTWYLYYSCSAFGRNMSAIGLMTNKTLNRDSPLYKWTDWGMVVQSIPGKTDWNAIDPNMIVDGKGKAWLTWGSFWDGIQLARLDNDFKTLRGKPKTIARRYMRSQKNLIPKDDRDRANQAPLAGTNAIEAPFLIHEGGYYYLFASWDYCCKGANSNYKTVVGRSEKISGPYLDRSGKDMAEGGGTIVAQRDSDYYGVGHSAAYCFDGQWWFVAHGYSVTDNGASKLVLKKMHFDADGWPVIDK
jgi:para-nitrobenzyl esterase